MPAPPGPEIVSTRVFSTPRRAVYDAFADPARLARWWGPEGFTNRFEEFDLRPGGAWRFTMRGPDGADYPMNKEFVEVVAPERIVIRHSQQGHGHVMTISLADEGEGTRVGWRMRFDDPEEAERVRPFILPANEQNFDRLAAHLGGKL